MTTRKKTSFSVSISKEERLSKVKSAFEGDKNAIDELICFIASFKDCRIRLLDELLKHLTPQNEHYIFTQPLLFWYSLTAVIQYAKTKQTAIEALLEGI